MTDSLPLVVDLIVTQKDIKYGRPNAPWSCPLALSAIRSFKRPSTDISCGDRFLYVGEVEYHYGPTTRRFVADFDQGKPVEPGTYRVERL
jgi:hypothetical protein